MIVFQAYAPAHDQRSARHHLHEATLRRPARSLRHPDSFPDVDAGHGWLNSSKLPPAELGIHPAEKASDEGHELFLMCDDVNKTVADLKKKKVKCGPVREAGFGIMTSIEIPKGGKLGLYQPKHPRLLR